MHEARIKGIYLLIGSNIFPQKKYILQAINEIRKTCKLIALSRLYESEPWGNPNQPVFLNQILEVETELNPSELLDFVLSIEKSMGRIREEQWGERIIDIDILYFNNEIINTATLTIPHPRIPERRFTLIPMCDIARGFIHPSLNKAQGQLLAECTDTCWARPLS